MKKANFEAFFNAMQVPIEEGFQRSGFISSAYRTRGYIYGPHRSFWNIPLIDEYKVVLVLRDPRDVLTSMYFAVAFSHNLLTKDAVVRRRRALEQTIDEFVLEYAETFLSRYVEYLDRLMGRENVMFCRYREMIQNPLFFLERLQEFTQTHLHQTAINRIVYRELAIPKEEDMYRIKRSARPGDHKSKLRPETIHRLNDIFAKVLDGFDFDI